MLLEWWSCIFVSHSSFQRTSLGYAPFTLSVDENAGAKTDILITEGLGVCIVQAVERQVSRCDKMSSSSPLKPTAASTAAAAAGSGGSGTSSVHHHQAVQLSNTSSAATPARTESTTARYCDMLWHCVCNTIQYTVTVTVIKPTTNDRNRHGFCRVRCHKGTYVMHSANVIATGACDIDDVLVKRQSWVECHCKQLDGVSKLHVSSCYLCTLWLVDLRKLLACTKNHSFSLGRIQKQRVLELLIISS